MRTFLWTLFWIYGVALGSYCLLWVIVYLLTWRREQPPRTWPLKTKYPLI